MLMKRKDGSAGRARLQGIAAGLASGVLDRRTFLRRSGLARGEFEADFSEQQRFFERHLKPWAARMFADLEMSQSARFYRAVGRVGRVFMELESEAFTLSE